MLLAKEVTSYTYITFVHTWEQRRSECYRLRAKVGRGCSGHEQSRCFTGGLGDQMVTSSRFTDDKLLTAACSPKPHKAVPGPSILSMCSFSLRGYPWQTLTYTLSFFFETRSLIEPGTCQLNYTGCPANSRDPPASAFPVHGVCFRLIALQRLATSRWL